METTRPDGAGGFDALRDGDLILCVNLLQADARDYEQMSDAPEHQAILQERAADRRALAARMKAEVERRAKLRNFAAIAKASA